jgi:hypothetical protein
MCDDGMMPISIEKKNVPSKYTYRNTQRNRKIDIPFKTERPTQNV